MSCHEALCDAMRNALDDPQTGSVWRSVRHRATRGALHHKGKANSLCHVCMVPISFSGVHTKLQNGKMNPAKQNKTKQNTTNKNQGGRWSRKRKEIYFGVWKDFLRPTAVGTHADVAAPSDPAYVHHLVSIDWCPWIDAQGSVWGDLRKDI